MLLDDAMQASKKEARDLEQALSFALGDYLKSGSSSSTSSHGGGDLESQQSPQHKLERDVEQLLDRVQHHIDRMESMGSAAGQSVAWKAQISRLRDAHVASHAEFKKQRDRVRHREESRQLLRQAKAELGGSGLDGQESEADRLYAQEREGIHTSMRMMDESIGKAMAIQDSLRQQTNRLRRATAGLTNMAESIPGINTLIRAAGRKKTRDNLIVAVAIALFVCFTLWWLFNA